MDYFMVEKGKKWRFTSYYASNYIYIYVCVYCYVWFEFDSICSKNISLFISNF